MGVRADVATLLLHLFRVTCTYAHAHTRLVLMIFNIRTVEYDELMRKGWNMFQSLRARWALSKQNFSSTDNEDPRFRLIAESWLCWQWMLGRSLTFENKMHKNLSRLTESPNRVECLFSRDDPRKQQMLLRQRDTISRNVMEKKGWHRYFASFEKLKSK